MRISRTMLSLVALLALAVVPALGQDAKPPATPQEPPRTADEIKRDAIQKGLEAQLKGEEIRVSITLRKASVQDGVEQFRRQVPGTNLIADYTNVPDDYVIDEFIVKDIAWRDALDAFLAKTGMMIEDEKPGAYIRLSRPAPVTIAFKEADIKVVVDLISRISRANIVLAPQVQGLVTLSVNDVPWNVVLESVVKSLGPYTIVRESHGMLRIVGEEELKKQMETRLFQLTYLQPPVIYKAQIKENNQIFGKPPQVPASIEDIVKQFTLLNMLRAMLTRSGGTTTLGTLDYDIATNAITVTDTKLVLERITDIIKVLDIEPDQVHVNVKFISTTNDDLLQFGINYTFGADEGLTFSTRPLQPLPPYQGIPGYGVQDGLPTGQVTRLPFGLGNEFASADTFFLSTYEVIATFRAFKRDRFSKLMQEPSLSALNNNEATIFVGETVPYAETKAQQTNEGGLIFTIGEGARSPVKVGFQLLILPQILRNQNKVIMTVIPVNETLTGTDPAASVAGFERFELQGAGIGGSPATIDLPRIGSTSLVTRLLVESGRTAVLGGLITERVSYEDKKIPILGDLPLINPLFRMRNDQVVREHLLAFVTPRVLRGARESEDTLRQQLRELEELERRQLDDMRRKVQQDEARRMADEQQKAALEEQRRLERK